VKINMESVVNLWISYGIKDFYISFEFEAVNKWHEYSTFFCHQGLEKICKAYLLATKAKEYESQSNCNELEKVNKIAKGLGHDLQKLFGLLCLENVLSTADISQKLQGYHGKELIDILEKAYIESRYPVPSPVHKKYPVANKKNYKMYSYPIGETAPVNYARNIALAVIRKLESDFSITISKNKISSKISDKKWKRFCNIFFDQGFKKNKKILKRKNERHS